MSHHDIANWDVISNPQLHILWAKVLHSSGSVYRDLRNTALHGVQFALQDRNVQKECDVCSNRETGQCAARTCVNAIRAALSSQSFHSSSLSDAKKSL